MTTLGIFSSASLDLVIAVCQFLIHDWRGRPQSEIIFIISVASIFNHKFLPLCRFIPYCSSDVWSGTGPAPTPPPRPRQGRNREREMSPNASMSRSSEIQIWASSKNSLFLLVWFFASLSSWIHLHGILDNPRGHQRPHSQRNQAGQGRHAVWHKVSLFYCSDADHSKILHPSHHLWLSLIPNIKQEKPCFSSILCQQ